MNNTIISHTKPTIPIVKYDNAATSLSIKYGVEQAIASYRASINISPENDEYRLVYTQVLDEYIDKKRNEFEKNVKELGTIKGKE